MVIEKIFNLIRLVVNKERKGFIKASQIKDAINAAEFELFTNLVDQYLKTGFIDDKLKPFRSSKDVPLTSGKSSSLTDVHELTSVEFSFDGGFHDAVIAREDSKWTSRKLTDLIQDPENPINPLHKYLKELTVATTQVSLPDNFIKAEGGHAAISGENFQGVEVPAGKWGSKKLSDLIVDKENPDDPMHLNTEEKLYTASELSSGSAAIPKNYVGTIAYTVEVEGKEFEGVFVKNPKDFRSKNFKDLIEDGQIKEHYAIDETLLSLTAGKASLPHDFIKDHGVFYVTSGADRFEGVILDNDEYLDRVNSELVKPTADEPVGRIVGGKIEVFPSTITSINLVYYRFPAPKLPVATVAGDKFKIDPIPTGNVRLTYLAFPSVKRPIFKIQSNKVHVDPVQADFRLSYLAYPCETGGLVRLISGGILEAKPSTITSARISYLKKMIPSVLNTTVDAGGRSYSFTTTGSTDTQFTENAVAEIAAKALKYLGIASQNAEAAQLEVLNKQTK